MSRPETSISVALCTCNGERYLAEQLAGIAAQERLPDELVIHDDASTDGTAGLVGRFAATAPMQVRLTVNPARLGVTRNFARAIADCRGELIVLADQDDLWALHKVRRLHQTLTERPDAGLVFSNAERIDADGRRLDHDLWRTVGFGHGERRRMAAGRELDVLLRHNVVTGATVAFRARWRDLVLPIPDGWIHDAWIALVIAAVAPLAAIDEPLVRYRQHAGQQIGERKRSLLEDYLRIRGRGRDDFDRTADNHEAVLRRLSEHAGLLRDGRALDLLRQKVSHFRAKARMRQSIPRRLGLIAGELCRGRYRRCSLGWKSLAQDLFS
ncbi:MAG TPA: glycosyltransferase family 2 protein [Thermoguttaceae bacterium]|nr:glycosyltransferase family 2 protein [Thermoguttaceae bacterium]